MKIAGQRDRNRQMLCLTPKRIGTCLQALARCTALVLLVSAHPAVAQGSYLICSYVIEAGGDGIMDNAPVTFGAVFVKGDVPAGSSVKITDTSGNLMPVQVDAKARYPDGSLRHAILTVVVPHLSGGKDFGLRVYKGPSSRTPSLPLDNIPKNFDVTINLPFASFRQGIAASRLPA